MRVSVHLLVLCLAVVAIGCTDEGDDDAVDDDAVDDDEAVGDLDGDGWTIEDGDCDDEDPQSYPGAMEDCDGIDNDCDGALGAWEVDDDGDGLSECDGDCNDEHDGIHPGAEEVCDGLDSDCDGVLPDDEKDLDGDHYLPCTGDCDDHDAAVSPGAYELCANGTDDNCDGVTDEDGCQTCDGWAEEWYPAVQAAIDAAADGATVCVEPGSYLECIDFVGKNVQLLGIGGAHVTLLDGYECTVVTFQSGEGPDAVLRGFTITDGGSNWYGGGISIIDSSPTLENLIVEGNTSGRYGGGIYMTGSASSLSRILVQSNGAPWTGGGIYMTDSTARLEYVEVRENSAGFGGGLHIASSSPTLSSILLRRNEAEHCGGLSVVSDSSPAIVGMAVLGNWATGDPYDSPGYGGGICVSTSSGAIDNVMVVGNLTWEDTFNNLPSSGGGLHVQDSDITVRQAAILGNEAVVGAGVALEQAGGLLANVSIAHNGSLDGGGGLHCGSCTTEFLSVNVALNSPGNLDGLDVEDLGDTAVFDAPEFLDISAMDPVDWDLHLGSSSPLIDAGDPSVLDPDGSPSDIGAYGGPGTALWDLDWDGYPAWWQPGPYDPLLYPGADLDCDDQDAGVYPGNGC